MGQPNFQLAPTHLVALARVLTDRDRPRVPRITPTGIRLDERTPPGQLQSLRHRVVRNLRRRTRRGTPAAAPRSSTTTLSTPATDTIAASTTATAAAEKGS